MSIRAEKSLKTSENAVLFVHSQFKVPSELYLQALQYIQSPKAGIEVYLKIYCLYQMMTLVMKKPLTAYFLLCHFYISIKFIKRLSKRCATYQLSLV